MMMMMMTTLALLCGVVAAQHAPGLLEPAKKIDPDRVPEERRFAEEARTDYFAQSSVLMLNKITFERTIMETSSDEVEHWVVFFCVSWWEGCQGLEEPYKQLANEWHGRANTQLMKNEVRFAAVDCAVDKVLCNSQAAKNYPVVNHYTQHAKVSAWFGGGRKNPAMVTEKLASWLWTRLGHLAIGRQNDELASVKPAASRLESWRLQLPGWAPDACVLVLAVLGNAFIVSWVFEAPSQAPCSSKESAETQVGVALVGGTSVGRFLPEDWSTDRQRIEL